MTAIGPVLVAGRGPRPARSLPAPGSVSPYAPITSPRAIGTR